MTIPQRGLWKNGVLHGVLQEHQIRQSITAVNKIVTRPAAIPNPPNTTHLNSHVPAPLPGSKRRQQPVNHMPTANAKDSAAVTHATRNQRSFIAGTASAVAPSATAAAKAAKTKK
jgi:hypothetical protein